MPRHARLDAPGALHHVMIRGINKGNIFEDDEDKTKFLAKLADTTRYAKASIYAFALMDNHAHILISSGEKGLAAVMRKTLTWYAVHFNRRHKRVGHLFQNRYKSILCEEDAYLLSLVRYIHLNPVRAGILTDIEALDRYPWSGHSLLMGNDDIPWMGRNVILGQFGGNAAYRRFIEEGFTMGHDPSLSGGGMVRSLGGWSQVVSMRAKQPEKGDERILGSSEFVLTVLADTEERQQRQMKIRSSERNIDTIIKEECTKRQVTEEEVRSGGRRPRVTLTRASIAYRAVTELGLSAAEAARHLGVTTSTVTRAVERVEKGQGGSNATFATTSP